MNKVEINRITFDNMPNALDKVRNEVSDIKQQLCDLKKTLSPKPNDVLLTRQEVAEMLKCDLTTVHNWTKQGKLIKYGIGDRVYYKRNEVEKALTLINVKKSNQKPKK